MLSMNVVTGALELGFIYALVAMALFLSFRVLNIADMTTDGSFTLGCAVPCQVALTGHPFLALLAAGLAGPVGLVCAALVVLLALAQVSALGVPYCAPVRFPQTALSPDGVTRRTYRTLSAHPFSIWQKRR